MIVKYLTNDGAIAKIWLRQSPFTDLAAAEYENVFSSAKVT